MNRSTPKLSSNKVSLCRHPDTHRVKSQAIASLIGIWLIMKFVWLPILHSHPTGGSNGFSSLNAFIHSKVSAPENFCLKSAWFTICPTNKSLKLRNRLRLFSAPPQIKGHSGGLLKYFPSLDLICSLSEQNIATNSSASTIRNTGSYPVLILLGNDADR